MPSVNELSVPGASCRKGKVRDIYDFGDQLLLVTSDRISAFDWVLPTVIPDKGCILNTLTEWWFGELDQPNHFITTDVDQMPFPEGVDRTPFVDRCMLVRKTEVFSVECIVRGYLVGSGWKEYQRSGTVCGIPLPSGLVEASKLPEPIFTPSTKAEQGQHDENISFNRMVEIVGRDTAEELCHRSLQAYNAGAEHALKQGIVIADTKFEFGKIGDEILLIDEVLTPDSSRFWPVDSYVPGTNPPSFDKQFVRDWLSNSGWDKNSPPPPLPQDIVDKTREKYIEAYTRLTGQPF